MLKQLTIVNKMNIDDDVEGRIHVENPANAKYKLNDVDGDDEVGIYTENMLEGLQKYNYKTSCC